MTYTPTYSLVLYTLNNDPSNIARDGLTAMLSEIGYKEEGDQSTMMLTDISQQPMAKAFLNELNALCQEVNFHSGDFVTLINSGYRMNNGQYILDENGRRIPVMRRFRFIYNPRTNSFMER